MNTMQKTRMVIALLCVIVLITACGTQNPGTQNPTPTDTRPLQGSVAILVIDDFVKEVDRNKTKVVLDEPRLPPSGGTTCAYTPDGQLANQSEGAQVFGSRGGGSTPLPDPHGDVVYAHLEALLSAWAGAPGSSPKIAAGRADVVRESSWKVPNPQSGDTTGVYLFAVDTQGYRTETVIDRIGTVVDWLRTEQMVSRVVLNLSFVIMPCDLSTQMATYVANLSSDADIARLEQKLAGFEELSEDKKKKALQFDPAFGAERLDVAYPRKSGEPPAPPWATDETSKRRLQEVIDAGGEVIPVAASGNHGLPYPFAPAIWPSVLSVSAADPQGYKANPGEVVDDDKTEYNGEPYHGTSFSAPRLTNDMAQYLLKGGTATCSGSSTRTVPPLGYSVSDRNPGVWKNLMIAVAAPLYCSPFP